MKSAYIIASLALILGVLAIEAVVFVLVSSSSGAAQPLPTAEVKMTIYAGELGDRYGFGLSTDKISSPAPDIALKEGKVVQIIFKNSGNLPHTFKITEERKWDAKAVFGASVGEPAKPLSGGQEGATTFKTDKKGSFFYLCTVPGHIEFGMFGKLTVES